MPCGTRRVLSGAEGFDFSRGSDPGPDPLEGWRLFTPIQLARSPLQAEQPPPNFASGVGGGGRTSDKLPQQGRGQHDWV